MKQIAEVIENVGDDLLQGVLAGGVIYHHGMAIAADVLALDKVHRRSPEMNGNALASNSLGGHETGPADSVESGYPNTSRIRTASPERCIYDVAMLYC